MRYLTKILILTACLIALSGVAAACNSDPLTQGYWKNHPDAWKDDHCVLGADTYTNKLIIGGVEYWSMDILNQPVEGDARIILAHQLIAARLNIENGACADNIGCVISASEDLLIKANPCLEIKVKPSSCPEAIALAEKLDKFNNGDY